MFFHAHVSSICRSSFYLLRNLSRIRKYLTKESAAVVVHAFVISELDYCNALLFVAELRVRGAPLLRKYGNPSIREILVIKAPYVRPSVRTYARTTVHPLDISQSEKWHSRCGQPAFFGGKTKKQAEDNKRKNLRSFEICLEMHAEIDALYDRHQKVYPSPNPHHKASNSAKHEDIWKLQFIVCNMKYPRSQLRAFLDISGSFIGSGVGF